MTPMPRKRPCASILGFVGGSLRLLENDRRRIELMNGILLSLPGTPSIYYGDEIGMATISTWATAMESERLCSGAEPGMQVSVLIRRNSTPL